MRGCQMKSIIKFTVCILSASLLSMSTYAATAYVDLNSPVDGPGTAWSNAFHTIQQGINAAGSGTVLVNDGIYEVGETVVQGSQIKTRVWIPFNFATVRSVNGPEVTIIKGQGPVGDDAVRCVAMSCDEIAGRETTLSGFTLTDGHTMTTTGPNSRGAGVYCYATNAVIENCIISNCVSDFRGGGAYGGILNNCKIVNNTAGESGGGAYDCILNNCTIADNTSQVGVWNCTLNNCIVWNNKWTDDAVYNWQGIIDQGTFNNSCTFPMPTIGTGNITNNPQFVSTNDYHLEPSSPCLDSGDNSYVVETTDLDGNERIYDGDRDGVATVDMGCYESIIKNTWYVNVAPHQSSSGGTSWDTAFYNIQSAILEAQDNDTVLVTNGVYALSGLLIEGTLGSRVAINKEITVKSVTGPEETIIKGFGDINGGDARRCAYVGTNAVLSGFTLREGHTRTSGIVSDQQGGGAWCEDGGVVSNCIITANSAYSAGGGVYKGTISRCTISSNSADFGGGVYFGTLDNCLLFGNSANDDGGGGYRGTYYNCTISSNSAANIAGGLYSPTVYNSIIWNNTALDDAYMNWANGDFYYCCTYPMPTSGSDNIITDPEFGTRGAKAFQPSPFSDCIDGGDNGLSKGLYDRIGMPRILDSDDDGSVIVDIGCYETLNQYADSDGDGMPDGWESDYGLNCVDPADADETADADTASNLAEYIAFTDPTDSNSYFCVTSFIISPETTLYFDSIGFRYYTLQSCSNLTDNSWADVPGAGPFEGGGLTLSDTNQTSTALYYRVKVSIP